MAETARSQQVAMLWELKTRLDVLHTGSRIAFSLLLRDAEYRRQTLDRALASADPRLTALARRLSPLAGSDSLLMDSSAWHNAGSNPLPDRSAVRRSRWPWLASLGALAMLIGAAVTWHVQQPVVVDGAIVQDTVWSRGRDYRLVGPVYVEGDAVLTIEPGVRVLGDFGSSLVITRNARIAATGTAAEPIVFTSARPAGKRAPGDWGGVVLLGNATVNKAGARIEGLPEHDRRGDFGGTDDTHACGVLQYARIEFAGYEVYADNELNGLTLGGCGSRTVVRNIQVHRALDDGVEVFGGTVDLRNIVITGAGDDGLDWDLGWRGRVQHLIVQLLDSGGSAMEGDSNSADPDALPRSYPQFYNVTLLGERNSDIGERALVLRSGTGASFHNLLVQGFFHEAVDLRGPIQGLVDRGELAFEAALFANVGPDGRTISQPELGDDDDDGGFDEGRWVAHREAIHLQSQDVISRAPGVAGEGAALDFAPGRLSVVMAGTAIPKGEFWQEGARYIGAVPPGQHASWLGEWTAFPRN